VKFAIHPVAGPHARHMNVLLAEAGVPYDLIADMDDINPSSPTPMSPGDRRQRRGEPGGQDRQVRPPIYGMPILDVVNAKKVIVIKRGKGTGFAGIENALFYADNTRMLYGDGRPANAAHNASIQPRLARR
jgi:NAD(P) transhydrogenase subunit beta